MTEKLLLRQLSIYNIQYPTTGVIKVSSRPLNQQAADLQIVHDVAAEQRRQRTLQREGKFQFVAGDAGDDHAFKVLTEEYLEAQEVKAMLKLARVMNDGYTDQQLYDELVQTAAVIQSWARSVLCRIRGEYNASLID